MQPLNLIRARILTACRLTFIGLLASALCAQESDIMENAGTAPEASEEKAKTAEIALPESDDDTEPEDELLYLMDDFVVSAEDDQGYYSANTLAGTRTNELTKNIPMTISTVNQEMLQDFGLNTLGDLGNLVPSIEWEGNSWSNSEIRFRGFLSKNQLYEFMPRYSPVDYYNIQRADVIRGANSLIYGQADPGGKINLISKTANFSKNETRYTVEFGDHATRRYVFDANRLIGDNAAVRVMATDKYKEFNQDYKYDDFRGVTLEAMAKVGKKTNLRLHLENTYSKKPRLNNSFQDGTALSGFTGMPQNIVADPKIADLMSDDLVNYIVDYNDPDNGNILRSQYPNGTVASDPDRVGRTGLLIPDYFSGNTMEEKRASIRDFYAGIDSQNTGTLVGPDAYQENEGNYVIGEISHVINDRMQLKIAISGEKLDGYSRTRGAANTLKHSLGYGPNINLPNAPGNDTYDDWVANGDQSKDKLGDRIGLYGDVQALRDDAANFQNNVYNSIGRYWVEGMTLGNRVVVKGVTADEDAKRLELAQSIASDLQAYLAGGALENASQTEFQQALENAVTDHTEQVEINGNTATRGFVNSRIDELFAKFTTTDPVNDDGSINPAVAGRANEVLQLYVAPYWQEQDRQDNNISVRTTLNWELNEDYTIGKQQLLIGIDADRRGASLTQFQEFQPGTTTGPSGVVMTNDRAADYIYLSDFLAGLADDVIRYNNTQSGFISDESDPNQPNSALVRDGKLAASPLESTVMHKTNHNETTVETLGTWFAASGSYFDGRARSLIGLRMDAIKVNTDLTDFLVDGTDTSVKDGDPYKNDSQLTFVEFSPSIGGLYWLTPELGVFGNYAESVLSPSGFEYDVFGEITPPETGRGIELGLKYSSGDGKINAQLTAFRIEKKNEKNTNITYSQLQEIFPRTASGDIMDDSTAIAANASLWVPRRNDDGDITGYSFDPKGNRVANEETRSEGVELDLYYNPTKQLSLFFGYAYLDTIKLKSSLEELIDLTIPGTSNHSANFTARYTFPTGKLKNCFIGANQKYRSAALLNTYFADTDFDGNADYESDTPRYEVYLEAQHSTDIFAGWQGKLGKGRNAPRARFQVIVNNVFDNINLVSTGSNNARYTDSKTVTASATFTF